MYHHHIATGLTAMAMGAVGLVVPSTPGAPGVAHWAPPRTGAGHPVAVVTVARGDTIAIGDGGWVTRRAAGEPAWSDLSVELPVPERAEAEPDRVAVSGNSVLVSYLDRGRFGTSYSTFVWRPVPGWREAVADGGPVWAGTKGVVGVGRHRYRPGNGWTQLPRIPLDSLAMGADAAGRVTAIGIDGAELQIARFTPGEGWARPIRVTGADRNDSVDLAVSPGGDRAITIRRDSRLVLFRRIGEQDWQRSVVTEGWTTTHRVWLQRDGAASVVWEQSHRAASLAIYSSRLGAGGGWSPVQEVARLTVPDRHDLVGRGTDDGRLAVAYRRSDAAGWTTYVRSRDADGHWSDAVEIAQVGDEYGLALTPDGCATGFAWAERLGRFIVRTDGPCAGVGPEPSDPRTAWMTPTSPPGALTYEADRIHVARTIDGRTLLGWTSLQDRQAMVAEWTLLGYSEPERLGPEGETCHLRRLDDLGPAVQAVLDCGNRQWYERVWTADSGWRPPTRMPDAEGLADFDVNDRGGTVGVFAGYSRAQPYGVFHRPTPDATWEELPIPPAFDASHIEWTAFVTNDNEIVLVDGDGREYVTYRPSTGAWSSVGRAPVATSEGVDSWAVSDNGAMLAWQPSRRIRDRFAVGDVDEGWSEPYRFDRSDPCRDVALAGRQVTVVEAVATCAVGERATLRARDFDIEDQVWSAPVLLGRGRKGVEEPQLIAGRTGAAMITWAHDGSVGFVRPDTIWRRPAGSTWSVPEYVPDGYDIDATILSDGTTATTSDLNLDAPGVWLTLR
jgi:hypothetical protein